MSDNEEHRITLTQANWETLLDTFQGLTKKYNKLLRVVVNLEKPLSRQNAIALLNLDEEHQIMAGVFEGLADDENGGLLRHVLLKHASMGCKLANKMTTFMATVPDARRSRGMPEDVRNNFYMKYFSEKERAACARNPFVKGIVEKAIEGAWNDKFKSKKKATEMEEARRRAVGIAAAAEAPPAGERPENSESDSEDEDKEDEGVRRKQARPALAASALAAAADPFAAPPRAEKRPAEGDQAPVSSSAKKKARAAPGSSGASPKKQ
eukprot:m51a1_g7436 hypothetical protein (266) ;mRNA; f:59087-60079